MPDFAYDITYDSAIECYVWWYDGAGLCLGGDSLEDAQEEVLLHVAMGEYPEGAVQDEGEEEVEYVDL